MEVLGRTRPFSVLPQPSIFSIGARTAILCLLAALVAGARVVCQAQSPPTEYELKAAFLYNFAKFVEWPPAKSPSTNSPFFVGVLGDDPFGPDLEKTINGKQVNGRPVLILRSKSEKQLAGCQIVFISSSERRRLGSIIDTFRGNHILTVSDIDKFCQGGGMINFRTDENKIRFEINSVAAQREELKLSSKLLVVAAKVWRQTGPE